MRRCELVAVAIVATLLATSTAARADHAAAQARFEAGRKLARDGRWQEAAAEFRASLALEESIGGHLNLGNAYEKLGKPASASEQFQRAEQLAGTADPERANEARSRREAIASKVPTIAVSAPSGASVSIDDKPQSGAAAVAVDPGTHVVTVSMRSGKTRTIDVDVKAGDRSKIVVPLDEDREIPPPVASPAPAAPSGDGDTLRTLGWVGIGVGAAALVASGVFYGLAVGDKGSLEETCPAYPRCQPSEIGAARDLDDSARGKSTIATITLVSGAVLAATGLVLVLVAPKAGREPREPRAGLSITGVRGGAGASALVRW